MKREPPFIIGHFPVPGGWRFSWIDADGERHESQTFETMKEVCRNQRRDYFMHLPVDVPAQIRDGEYLLLLTVWDEHSKQSNNMTIPFKVRRK